MATLEQFQAMTTRERQNRYFSEAFRRQKVSEVERNLTSVAQICKTYQVTAAAVYKWIHKYSAMRQRQQKQVVEAKSDTHRILLLQAQLKEYERLIGQKQIKIEVLEKVIDLAEETYRVDIKKKFSSARSSGSGSTGKTTKSK
jgi:transposase-like protein